MEATAKAVKVELDVRGFKCPIPVLKMTNMVMGKKVQEGETLVVLADCDTFEEDVRKWCTTMKKVLIVFRSVDEKTQCAEVMI